MVKFIVILILGVLLCYLAAKHVSREEALAQKKTNALRIVISILIWIVASMFFVFYILMFTDMMQSIIFRGPMPISVYNGASLYGLSWTFIAVVTGISVLNYRKSYYNKGVKILRVSFSICVIVSAYLVFSSIISGFDFVYVAWMCFVVCYGFEIRNMKINSEEN